MSGKTIRIGARASKLARIQARQVMDALVKAHGLAPDDLEFIPFTTKGDRLRDRAFSEMNKEFFVRDIETALSAGRIDLAVHSLKDMPHRPPDGLALSCLMRRADPRDALVVLGGAQSLRSLPHRAQVGAAGPRRRAQIGARAPHLRPVLLRGNIDTRLAKLQRGEADALILALCGLRRLGVQENVYPLSPRLILPAPAQGVVAVERRLGDRRAARLVLPLHHLPTARLASAERAFSRAFGGSCRTPLAALASALPQNRLSLRAELLSPDGKERHALRLSGPAAAAAALGRRAAALLRRAASPQLLAALEAEA